jgi:hypothetical protein
LRIFKPPVLPRIQNAADSDDQGEDDQGEAQNDGDVPDVDGVEGSTAYSHKNKVSWEGKGTSVVM